MRNSLYGLFIYLKLFSFRIVSKIHGILWLNFYAFWVFATHVFYKCKPLKYLGIKTAFKGQISTKITYAFTSRDVSWDRKLFIIIRTTVSWMFSVGVYCWFWVAVNILFALLLICRLLDIWCSNKAFSDCFNTAWLSFQLQGFLPTSPLALHLSCTQSIRVHHSLQALILTNL